MVGFAFATSFLVYNAFLRGIYNYRAREIINMRSVPTPLKAGLSIGLGIYIARDMHFKSIYEPDLYRIALKYRT